MAKPLLGIAARAFERAGYRLAPKELRSAMPDVEEEFYELHGLCSAYSAAGPERLYAAYQAAQHVARELGSPAMSSSAGSGAVAP